MPTLSLRIVLLSLLGAAGACGGGDSNPFPSDIDRDETLDKLEEAAYQKMCSSFEDWVYDQYAASPIVRSVCMAIALEDTETASECGEALQTCLENPPPEATALLEDILAQASCEALSIERETCTSTVGRIQDCLDGLGAAIDRIELTLTCAAAGQSLDPGWWQVDVPGTCVALESKC